MIFVFQMILEKSPFLLDGSFFIVAIFLHAENSLVRIAGGTPCNSKKTSAAQGYGLIDLFFAFFEFIKQGKPLGNIYPAFR